MGYRTTVNTSADDPDETDEYPGCAGSIDPETGELAILDAENGVQEQYGEGEWIAVTTSADYVDEGG